MMATITELQMMAKYVVGDAVRRQEDETIPDAQKWSLQGFGMFRLYVNKFTRLHVWSRRHAVPNVSDVHTHPWDFTSTVLAGAMLNVKYVEHWRSGAPFTKALLRCGPEGGLEGEPVPVKLSSVEQVRYHDGCRYEQRHDEIHTSHPEHGTVTIVERRFRPDTEHAYVYWRSGTEWVSARPRLATVEEVADMREAALRLFV